MSYFSHLFKKDYTFVNYKRSHPATASPYTSYNFILLKLNSFSCRHLTVIWMLHLHHHRRIVCKIQHIL